MKAKIKKTGEIVEVILDEQVGIDWEQRRYEIAKEVMAAYISNGDYAFNHGEEVLAEWSLIAADKLIEELK